MSIEFNPDPALAERIRDGIGDHLQKANAEAGPSAFSELVAALQLAKAQFDYWDEVILDQCEADEEDAHYKAFSEAGAAVRDALEKHAPRVAGVDGAA